MQHTPSDQSRVRYVFNDAVVVFPMGDRPTLGDIAQALEDLPTRLLGCLVAIEIAWPAATRHGAVFETARA